MLPTQDKNVQAAIGQQLSKFFQPLPNTYRLFTQAIRIQDEESDKSLRSMIVAAMNKLIEGKQDAKGASIE